MCQMREMGLEGHQRKKRYNGMGPDRLLYQKVYKIIRKNTEIKDLWKRNYDNVLLMDE